MNEIVQSGGPARRYAHEIITAPEEFDGIEVHPMCNRDGGTGLDNLEPADGSDPPDAFSVFVHFILGGVDCIGDFKRLDAALGYALELADMFEWPILDLTGTINFTGDGPAKIQIITETHTRTLEVRKTVTRYFDAKGEVLQAVRVRTEIFDSFERQFDEIDRGEFRGDMEGGSGEFEG